MIVDRSYVAENDGQRERLRALVARLSDGELGRHSARAGRSPPSWATWRSGTSASWFCSSAGSARGRRPCRPRSITRPSIGSTTPPKPLLLALPARQAADVAVAIAEAVDRKVRTL